MARVTWLQRRGVLIGLSLLFVAGGLAIVVEQFATHVSYASYLANGGANTNAFSALVIALNVLPVVIGVFVGAPLLSRELESGTFRFTWTQEIGRTRFVLTTLVLLAGFTVAAACALGLLLGLYAHRFEVIGLASHWQSGQFDVTFFTLAAWTLFALVLGTFLGAVIGRIVTAMAATAVGVGGLVVSSFVFLVHRLLAVSPLVTSGISPFGIGLGTLNMAAPAGTGPSGSWLVRSWLTGPGANNVLSQIEKAKDGQIDATRLLALHHDAFWVSYQPASRFWIFQGVEGAILIVLAALLVLGTLWVVRRRA
jgi:hypothetical protein